MNKTWITTLSVAGVVGSGAAAAFAASATITHGTPAAAKAAPIVAAAAQSRTIEYQVGAAGSVTVVKDAVGLTIASTTVGTGWTLVGTSVVGTTVSAQFSDGTQTATFSASMAGDEIAAEVASMALPPAQIAGPVGDVVILSDTNRAGGDASAAPEIAPTGSVPRAAALPMPAPTPAATTPATAAPAVTSPAPTNSSAPVNTQPKPAAAAPVSTPTTAHTTSPSAPASGGSGYEDDDHDDDSDEVTGSEDHENKDHENEDHEDESEDGGDDD